MKKAKTLLTLIFAVFMLFFLTSCTKSYDPNKVVNYLKDMKSYRCDIHMTVKNYRQSIQYDAKETYLKGSGYRLELGGQRVFTYKGDRIYVDDLNNKESYSTDKNFDSTLRLSFVGEYIDLMYTDEDIKYSYETLNGVHYQLIDITVPGNNKNIKRAVMYVDTKSKLPGKVKVYDFEGNERIDVTYYNFTPNVSVKAQLFD